MCFSLCDLSLSQTKVTSSPDFLVIAITSTEGCADLEENFLSQALKYKLKEVSEGQKPIRTQPCAMAELKVWLIFFNLWMDLGVSEHSSNLMLHKGLSLDKMLKRNETEGAAFPTNKRQTGRHGGEKADRKNGHPGACQPFQGL